MAIATSPPRCSDDAALRPPARADVVGLCIGTARWIENVVVTPAVLLALAAVATPIPVADRPRAATAFMMLCVAIQVGLGASRWAWRRIRPDAAPWCWPSPSSAAPGAQVYRCAQLGSVLLAAAATYPYLGVDWAPLEHLLRLGLSLALMARLAAIGFVVIGAWRATSAATSEPKEA